MKLYTISTLPRFLYLNLYAFLLVFLGIGILVIPINYSCWVITSMQILVFLYCEKTALKMFRSWKEKQRKYDILIKRNQNEFRADTFKEFMQAPCGILLARLVLKDLNLMSQYPALKMYQSSLKDMTKLCCRKQVTVIRFNEK